MDPQLLARLQQMLGGGGAPPPPMGGGMPAGMVGFGGPSPGGSSQFNGSPWPQPPPNARPMPAPPGGGMNMPMGAPSGGWPLGLARQGRPPDGTIPNPPPPGGRPPGGDRPRQPQPDGRPPPLGTKPPKPKPAAPAAPAAPPQTIAGAEQQLLAHPLMQLVGRNGITRGDVLGALRYGGGAGGDVMARFLDRAHGWGQAAAPTPTPKPKPTPKPDDRPRQPRPDGRPPPGTNPSQQGAPSGFPAQTVGVNPIITPMFRHLFSPQDVARYGIRQPNVISNATFDDKGLHWQTGTQKRWWEPNNPVEWKKDKKD